jgi:hypothetical protein
MKVKEREKLLAYCGIYCGDCLGYTGVIADAAKRFMYVLDQYQFHRSVKAIFPDKFEQYGTMQEVLTFMEGLKCPKVCRDRGENADTDCPVRKCCREKDYYACYECDTFENCEKLRSMMGGLHDITCISNLRGIKEMGLREWILHGERHCYWMETDDRT